MLKITKIFVALVALAAIALAICFFNGPKNFEELKR